MSLHISESGCHQSKLDIMFSLQRIINLTHFCSASSGIPTQEITAVSTNPSHFAETISFVCVCDTSGLKLRAVIAECMENTSVGTLDY